MLADYAPVPTLAVTDLKRAREFYEGVLGFTPGPEVADGVFYAAGSGSLFVYPSGYAGTNKATAVSFQVPDGSFDAEVSALREKGISFQTFEMDGISWEDGVATFAGSFRSAWFEDPDGNILNVESVPT
jgi:catechol 2,3-dioxygenase-like lactoylglutathione lyase family enzyme